MRFKEFVHKNNIRDFLSNGIACWEINCSYIKTKQIYEMLNR